MQTWLFVLFLASLLLGYGLLRLAEGLRRRTGLPSGRVIYADTGSWSRCEEPLFSPRYRLTGRPDYLVEKRGRIIPVEVKSGLAPPEPYRSHLLQLAAYCLLIEEEYGHRPPYGLIKYQDHVLQVDYTPALRQALLDTLALMRRDLPAAEVPPGHVNPRRCRRCGYRSVCGQEIQR